MFQNAELNFLFFYLSFCGIFLMYLVKLFLILCKTFIAVRFESVPIDSYI